MQFTNDGSMKSYILSQANAHRRFHEHYKIGLYYWVDASLCMAKYYLVNSNRGNGLMNLNMNKFFSRDSV